MAGDKRVVNYVRHASRPFIFCASIPPANCATAIEALHILRSHPEMPKRLVELAAYMRKGLLERGIAIRDSITPIIPIYTYDEMRTLRKAKELFDAGVYVNPVLPPATPPGESLLRTSYMANHTETILDETEKDRTYHRCFGRNRTCCRKTVLCQGRQSVRVEPPSVPGSGN